MTLFVTEFDRSVKNRVIHSDDCTATVNKNVAGGPCTLMSIVIDNIEGDTTNYVRCSNGSSGTVGADDSYDLTEVQLEIGSEPTPFELINYQDELLHCKRYYRTYGPGITGYWNGSSNIEFMFTFIPEMRATPTFAVLVTGPVISNKTNSATATEEDVAVVNSSGTVNGMYFAQVGSCEDTSPSAGDIAQLRTDKFVSFDAEL